MSTQRCFVQGLLPRLWPTTRSLVLLSLVALFLMAPPALAQQPFLRGDCNGDLTMNISDPIFLLAYLFNSGAIECEKSCDANDDGSVNLADAIYTLSALFSGGSLPPAPHPNCGTDPTADALTCDNSPCPAPPMNGELREVDVAYLGGTPAGDGLLVSVTGSGAQHQFTSWNLAQAGGQPTALVTEPPSSGHHPKLLRLSGLASLVGNPPFVTGTIRDDTNLWLSSRRLDAAGTFFHQGTVGYGSNAAVEVLSYAIAKREVFNGFFLDRHIVVTPVVTQPVGGGPRSLRIVTWRIDAQTDVLSGLQDSGDLPISFPQSITADEAAISVSHLQGIQFVLTFTNSVGNLENRFFWVEDDGSVFYAGGASGGRNLRDTASVSIPQEANAVAAVTASGFVTANRAPGGALAMSVWERRADGFLNWEPYQISDNSHDLLPNGKGVFLPAPALTDSYAEEAEQGDFAGSKVATGDFNGDGYDDALISAPRRHVAGFSDVGEVFVIHGNSAGITGKEYTQVWSQHTSGVAGATEDNDRFGEALAVGDFNGDGNDDAAIGVPYEDIGGTSAGGSVNILYGTPFGLSTSGNHIITQGGLGHTASASDLFGFAVTAGDFNNDGFDDLAASAPGREVGGHTDGGVVYVIWGAATGLGSANQLFHQDSPGIQNVVEDFDRFGEALTVGNFNGDSSMDLVIGVPSEGVGNASNAGGVHVLYGNGGSATGFSGANYITQAGFDGGSDIRGAVEAGDEFGAAVAAGDFNGDGADDLAIGVPGEAVGSIVGSGAVNVVYGTIFGLSHIGNEIISQDTFNPSGGTLPAFPEEDDQLGFSLSTGDYDDDGYDDLIAGAPGKGVPFACSNPSAEDVGAFFEIFGGANGLSAAGSSFVHQNACDASGRGVLGDRYAESIASGDFNADGECDVVIGIPRKACDDGIFCGAVHFLSGTSSGLSYSGDEEWFVRRIETVRGLVSDLAWEESGGPGNGQLYSKSANLGPVHVASVAKVMTLLLTVEAIEAGTVDELDLADITSLAGNTGGSFLEQWDNNGPVLDMGGNEIRFIQTGDSMPLDMLLHGMMMRSGNRCSVGIGQHVADEVFGNIDSFVTMMNLRAVQLQMFNSTCGHPAGGLVTKAQDLMNLLVEGWDHPQFRVLMGTEIYGVGAPPIQMCGTDSGGMAKCNSPFTKFQTIGDYPGRLGWKGGNGGLWWGSSNSYGYPGAQPSVSWCTSSAVAVVERASRNVGMAVLQTGDRVGDSQNLLDHGFRKIFTPDRCAEDDFPTPGGIVGPAGPIRVRAFAIDALDSDHCVTAVIDDYEELRLNVWQTDFANGQIDALASASLTYTLPYGTQYAPTPLTRITRLPSSDAIGDYMTANLEGEHLQLELWRIGETP